MITCTALAIGLHIGTYHFDRTRDYNEVNLGAYVECDHYTAGIYRNSLRKTSAYAGYTFDRVLGPVDVTVGAVSGYPRAALMPLLVPSVKLGSARLSLLLPIEKGGGGVHLSWEY